MADTFQKIATVTVGSGGASSIDFSSIPSTYTDLQILLSIRTDKVDTDDWIELTFNNSGGTSYSDRILYGNGTTAASTNESSAAQATYGAIANASSSTANSFANCQVYIPNYAGSQYKSFSSDSAEEQNATKAFTVLTAGLWSNTATITSIKFRPSSVTNFVQYSSATLYGILKA